MLSAPERKKIQMSALLEGRQIHVGRVALHECQTMRPSNADPGPGRPKWTVMSPCEFASFSGNHGCLQEENRLSLAIGRNVSKREGLDTGVGAGHSSGIL